MATLVAGITSSISNQETKPCENNVTKNDTRR